jgi:hypothetical protein
MKRIIIGFSLFSLMCCCSKKENFSVKIDVPVDSITYANDKKQIANCFVENVEYYRQNPDSIDYSNHFGPYSECFNLKEDKYQRISYPAKEAIDVTTDAILYSPNKLFCFAFLVIKGKYKNAEVGIEEKMRKGREYDAKAIIGYRENEKDVFRIYPVQEFSVVGFEGYQPAVETLKESYFTKLTKIGVLSSGTYEGLKLINVGDKDFFKKSPYFKKTKEGLYYFQIYKELKGNLKEYQYQKCN